MVSTVATPQRRFVLSFALIPQRRKKKHLSRHVYTCTCTFNNCSLEYQLIAPTSHRQLQCTCVPLQSFIDIDSKKSDPPLVTPFDV